MKRLLALLCLAFSGWLSATAAELQVDVRHTFAGEPLLLDSLRYVNAAGEPLSVTRLSYLLSGFALRRVDGEWVELRAEPAWIDAGQRRTGFRLPEVPAGRYTALRLHIGPDAAMNAAPVASFAAGHPLNANLNGLHWSWQGGFVFLALEGSWRAKGGELDGYAYHLARDANRTELTVPLALQMGGQPAAAQLEFDLARFIGGGKPLSLARDGTATHSRDGDTVAAALVANLSGAWRAQTARTREAAQPAARPRPLYLPAKFTPYRFSFNRTFPIPELPADNPLIEERVALGQRLFSEVALSRDRTLSCASCHRAEHALAEPLAVSRGVDGRAGERNAMPLQNLAWKSTFFWDGRAPSLRAQVLVPIAEHREMDLPLAEAAARLSAMPGYVQDFAASFSTGAIDAERIGLALEQFLLTQTAGTSKFDRALRHEAGLTAGEQRGFELFMTEYDPRTGQRGADCFHCHGGPLFSDFQFHQNGLAIDERDLGRERVTGRPADRGKFATPSLRNVARTAPYMHDGRFATLEEVVHHYNAGIERTPTLDPNLAKHPAAGLGLSAEDEAALVSFLCTLSDE